MELKDLYYMIAVAETGSMHLAAKRLHVSQQNVSRVLNKFEQELQISLFDSSSLGTMLTPEGEKIYSYAIRIINDVQLLMQEIKTFPHETYCPKGNISIYYSNSLNDIVDNFIFSFQKYHPNTSFSAIEATTKDCFALLQEKSSSIFFLQLSIEKLNEKKMLLSQNYECYLLANEALNLVIHKDNPLAKQSTISLKKLSSLSFTIKTTSIDNIPEYVQTILDMGIPLNIKYCSNSSSSIAKYIKHNQACTLSTNVNRKFPDQLTNDLVSIRIRERIYIALCVLLPKTRDFCGQQFIDHIINSTSSYSQKLF